MATHKFEIQTASHTWSGQIDFDGGENIQFSLDDPVEETHIADWQMLINVLSQMGQACQECGEVIKFEIVKNE